jgi:UDP-N-acetylmuramate dehydrogenase
MFDGMVLKKNYDFGSLHGYKAKGLVSFYVETSSKDELSKLISFCKNEKLKFNPCGGGSNTLIKDKFNGVFVFWTDSEIKVISQKGNKVFVKVGSAFKKADLNDFCVKEGLSGLEFWAGIPGLVGGGAAMNAGAYGKEVKNCVNEIFYVTEKEEDKVKSKDLKWSYRRLDLPKYSVITDVVFELTKSDKKSVKELSDSYIADRENKHPLEYPSCGSVFKNPDNSEQGAWWYIREAGLCGFSIGGAKVSEKHSNFIINADNATAMDVINLIEAVKNKVKVKFNISLEEEIKIYE